ncbi:MAG: hypothetical protein EXS05_07510 [Planctomycetaceae bacterium]|nr:hypothetical protein [Planctomycetaceae bacterium]
MTHPAEPSRQEPASKDSRKALIKIAHVDEQAAESTRRRIRKLPPEVGAVLIGAGIVGFILPGPIGTPLLLAGGLVLIPRAFNKIDGWVQRTFPKSYGVGMKYVDRFLDDFERRYPPGDPPPNGNAP